MAKKDLEKRIFLIGPVRNVSKEEKKFIDDYVLKKEREGYKVHYPPRDTNQDDPVGLNICLQNKEAIITSHEVHIYWNPKSEDSLFDFGMTFMAGRPIYLFNRDSITATSYKSFTNMLLKLHEKYMMDEGYK